MLPTIIQVLTLSLGFENPEVAAIYAPNHSGNFVKIVETENKTQISIHCDKLTYLM